MYSSRLGKFQERKLATRLVLALAGSIILILFILFFGLKILINFSLLVGKLKSSGKDTSQSQPVIILPPVLDPFPEATNSASLNVSGHGTSNLTLILYVNDKETKKVTIDKTGNFLIKDVPLSDGHNDLKAKLVDAQGNKSDVSNIISTSITHKQPKLDITSPTDNSTVMGDENTTIVAGSTDDGNDVIINNRIVVVNPGGSFSYKIQLSEGDNTLSIISTDAAGNQTKVERHVKYQK
jgi:hypothetical protein